MNAADAAALAKGQQLFDFMLPRKATLRPDELADVLNVTPRSILRAFDTGELMGIGLTFSAAADQVQRTSTRRIPRDCAILYLARHANYSPEELELRLLEVLGQQPAELLLRLQNQLPVLISQARTR